MVTEAFQQLVDLAWSGEGGQGTAGRRSGTGKGLEFGEAGG